MSHLFLSYSHKDGAMAQRLAQGLQARGFALWYDRELRPGERWLQRLTRAARDCAALLLLMSPAAEQSPWVEMELCIALRYRRPVLPLALQGHHFDALAHLQHV
ncbi:MAG: toll/interleukin-1 receptor domain-containing protein, partial [Anaerolineaceae bacterium]|nr:toll/interleukin-1 receptor domain-containing protein [Anaerolineaceae bacterium]